MAIGYTTQTIPQGLRGVNLSKAVDLLSPLEWQSAQNLQMHNGEYVYVRPGFVGLTVVPAAGTPTTRVHSIGRLDALTGAPAYARLYGADTKLYIGQAGAMLVTSGFSGNPLSFCPHHSEKDADSWMFVGDSTKVCKVRIDGTVTGIGIAAPTVAPSAVITAPVTKVIETFVAGFNPYNPTAGSGATVLTYPIDAVVGQVMQVATQNGTAVDYIAYADKAIGPIDLTTFGGGVDAGDSEYMHFFLKIDNPQFVEEVRLYLIVSPFTTGSANTPGTSAVNNTDAYMKSFRPSDVTSLIEQVTVAIPTAADVQQIDLGTAAAPEEVTSVEMIVGRGAWTTFGTVDKTLQKSDFLRIGTRTDVYGWATVQGIAIWVKVIDEADVNVSVGGLYMEGGYGLDNGAGSTEKYQWAFTHVDRRTNEESSRSALMDEADQLRGILRGRASVTPIPFGSGDVFQRFYRKGGTVTDDFYLDGENVADGGVYTTGISDLQTIATGLVAPDNHDRLVTSETAAGVEILAQPLPIIFGPLSGMLIALGDPNKPGHVYWSLPEEPDYWPAANNGEVCPSSEVLLNGGMLGGTAFVVSRKRGYFLIANPDGPGTISSVPAGFSRGAAGRWAFCVGRGFFAIIARDGIYLTTGQDSPDPVSDDLKPLFIGQTKNGYLPIDFAQESDLRIVVHHSDLYFSYRDTGGTVRWWWMSLLYRAWVPVVWALPIAVVSSEDGAPGNGPLLIGCATNGTVYEQSGTTDAGTAIPWGYRTGTLNQGDARADKRYGDVAIDMDARGDAVELVARTEDESVVWASVAYGGTNGETQAIRSPFGDSGGVPINPRARNVSLEVSGSSTGIGPWIRRMLLAYAAEPADYLHWQTDEIGHGIPEWKSDYILDLAYRATAAVTLTIKYFNDLGELIQTQSSSLVSTGAVKRVAYVTLPNNSYIAAQYFLSSTGKFRVYENESWLHVQPHGKPGPIRVQPFSTTDRQMEGGRDPMRAAILAGGAG